ncbi:unnamed protein product, partial [marine sediment metagenome]
WGANPDSPLNHRRPSAGGGHRYNRRNYILLPGES